MHYKILLKNGHCLTRCISRSNSLSAYIVFNAVLQEALVNNTFPDSGLPVAEIFVLAGFLMIYLLEEVVHLFLILTLSLMEQEVWKQP